MADAAIRNTDSDAAASRLSAVKAGYLEDAFAHLFVKHGQTRPPLINVGTFLRTWSIDRLVLQFLDAPSRHAKQILSLGAGTDTRFFRIASTSPSSLAKLHKYVEVDFPEATAKKAMILKKDKTTSSILSPDLRLEQGGTALSSSVYHLLPGDLRDFRSSLASQLGTILDPKLPLLVLAECVTIYLPPAATQSVLSWALDTWRGSSSSVVLYDPVGLDDSFGKVMIHNLQARGIQLLGLEKDSSIQMYIQRLSKGGYEQVDGVDLKAIRTQILPATEMERLSRLEMLDEVEELDLILAHYALVWAHTVKEDCINLHEWSLGGPKEISQRI